MESVTLYVVYFDGFPSHTAFINEVLAAARAALARRGVECSERRLALGSLDGGAAVETVGRDVPAGRVLGCYFFIPTADTRDDLGAYLLPAAAWRSMVARCEAAGIFTVWPHSQSCWEAIETRSYLLELSATERARSWATPTARVPRGDYAEGAASSVLKALQDLEDSVSAGNEETPEEDDSVEAEGEEQAEDEERFVVKLPFGAYGGHVRVVKGVDGLLDAIDVLFEEGPEAELCLLQRYVPHALEARVWTWREPRGRRFGAFVDEWTSAVPFVDHRRGGVDGEKLTQRKVPREEALALLDLGGRSPAAFEAELVAAAAAAAEVVASVLEGHARDAADTASFRLDFLVPAEQPGPGVALRLVELTPAHGDVEDFVSYSQVARAKWEAALEAALGPAHAG